MQNYQELNQQEPVEQQQQVVTDNVPSTQELQMIRRATGGSVMLFSTQLLRSVLALISGSFVWGILVGLIGSVGVISVTKRDAKMQSLYMVLSLLDYGFQVGALILSMIFFSNLFLILILCVFIIISAIGIRSLRTLAHFTARYNGRILPTTATATENKTTQVSAPETPQEEPHAETYIISPTSIVQSPAPSMSQQPVYFYPSQASQPAVSYQPLYPQLYPMMPQYAQQFQPPTYVFPPHQPQQH